MTEKPSGFTFVHNAMDSGYPIVEAIEAVRRYTSEIVAVDMESTDNTRAVLEQLGCRVLSGGWHPGKGGGSLAVNHALHKWCESDTVLHFEGDEVFSANLLDRIRHELEAGETSLSVWRLQVEQNFQRIRWYPTPVHRIFRKGNVKKVGHTTDRAEYSKLLPPDAGFLWDCASTFKDNYIPRMKKQAELWGHEPIYRLTSFHFKVPAYEITDEVEIIAYLEQPHWLWETTPLAIPEILVPLVGKEMYRP
jgi:glycosyltransferase involved in cell wall biosynthesis